MSDSTSKLDTIATAQAQKEVTANAMLDAASQSMIFGRRASTTAALTWGFYGGRFTKSDGTNVNIANNIVALTASNTNYVEADGTGAVTANTTAFTDGRIPLYTVVAGASTVSSYTDNRDGTQGNFTIRNSKKRINAQTWGSSMTLDWGKYDLIRVTLGGATTFTFSNAVDGQSCILELLQDGTGSRTVTFPGDVRWPTDIAVPTLTTTANKMDRIGFLYNNAATKYDAAAVVKGY